MMYVIKIMCQNAIKPARKKSSRQFPFKGIFKLIKAIIFTNEFSDKGTMMKLVSRLFGSKTH